MTMETSRQDILTAIRQHAIPQVELPNLDQDWTTYTDPQQQFRKMLEAVGGQCVVVAGEDADLNRALEQIPAYSEATHICSTVPNIRRSNVDLSAIEAPHDLKDVDFAVAAGAFAVAENGAVWVTDASVAHRALFFIAQHLALVVPTNEIVHNMHQAYERLTISEHPFGCFISGPSKTADIEQSLVIGAQGPRSLTVLLVES